MNPVTRTEKTEKAGIGTLSAPEGCWVRRNNIFCSRRSKTSLVARFIRLFLVGWRNQQAYSVLSLMCPWGQYEISFPAPKLTSF